MPLVWYRVVQSGVMAHGTVSPPQDKYDYTVGRARGLNPLGDKWRALRDPQGQTVSYLGTKEHRTEG